MKDKNHQISHFDCKTKAFQIKLKKYKFTHTSTHIHAHKLRDLTLQYPLSFNVQLDLKASVLWLAGDR